MPEIKYGYWRTDKPKEDGYSHELISADTSKVSGCNLDELHVLPAPGINTVYKALQERVKVGGTRPFLGTRTGK